MILYVVRHGEVPSNVSKIISGCNDEKLTQNGIKQALKIKDKLSDINFDVVYCSPVLRTKQTANIIASNYDIVYDDRLCERNPGNMLGHKRSELDKNEWNTLEKEITIYGSESLLAGIQRTQNFIKYLEDKYPNKTILIITHMFICKCIWMIENNVFNTNKANDFFQSNDEVKIYNHNLI